MTSKRRLQLGWLVAAAVICHHPKMIAGEADIIISQFVYIGTYTGTKSKGIYVARFDPVTGKLGAVDLAAETKNPTFLALAPNGRVLYAANEVSDYGNERQGTVSAFEMDGRTGKLTFLNQQASGGAGPCHLTVDQTGKSVLVANYGSGSIAVLPIEVGGRMRAASAVIQHRGSSINSQRQTSPHAHFITVDPANRLALACDLGLDQVLVYGLDPTRGLLTPNDPPLLTVKPGSGPRHLAFAPNGTYVYLLNELASTLMACRYDATRGTLTEIQTISTLPDDFKGSNTDAEVQVDPSGKRVYASNRGHNSIAVFTIEPTTGKVSLLQHQSTQGKTPRHFSLDPSGKWLLAENQDSDNVVVLKVDQDTGRLSPTGQSVGVGMPVCVLFARAR